MLSAVRASGGSGQSGRLIRIDPEAAQAGDHQIDLGERIGPSWEAVQTALYERAPTTLCHGDFRADNLMFDDSATGREHVGILDWQIAYRSGGIGDVCYLTSTRPEALRSRRIRQARRPGAYNPGFSKNRCALRGNTGI